MAWKILGANYCRTNAAERVKKNRGYFLIAFHHPIL